MRSQWWNEFVTYLANELNEIKNIAIIVFPQVGQWPLFKKLPISLWTLRQAHQGSTYQPFPPSLDGSEIVVDYFYLLDKKSTTRKEKSGVIYE